MKGSPRVGEIVSSFDEPAFQSLLLIEAIIQLLIEKSVLTDTEVRKRVQKLREEAVLQFRPPG
jgi:hypothetical protein